jgi:hypothetical protein
MTSVVLVQLPPMPIGPLTLAAVSHASGFPLELIDFPERHQEQEVLNCLAAASVAGFSTVCNMYPRTILLAQRLKARNPQGIIVFGGPQSTATAYDTLRLVPAVDLIIRGEAELAWSTFLKEVQDRTYDWSKIPGAVWRQGGIIRETPCLPPSPDLDALPMPRYEQRPAMAQRQVAMVEVGRGCPFTCTFCSTNTYFSRRPRMKSPGRILQEMRHLHTLYGCTIFDFVHDMFTYHKETVQGVCAMLKNQGFYWGCSSRTDTLNAEMMEMMAEAGCLGFYFGIETGSPRLQKLLKKNLDLTRTVQGVRLAKRLGFNITASIILGFPQETREDLKDSLLLITDLMLEGIHAIQVPLWGPLFGTPLTNAWQTYGFDGKLSNFTADGGELTPEEIELIRSNFNLFSTFYHPLATDFDRQDYLALTAFLEELPQYPLTRRFLLERERLRLVNFLSQGGYGARMAGFSGSKATEALLSLYAAQTRDGGAVARMLNLDRLFLQMAAAPPGWQESCRLGADEARLVLSEAPQAPPVGPGQEVILTLRKNRHRVEISVQG